MLTPVKLIGRGDDHAEWPRGVIDPDALQASGWQPVPFRQFLFKVFTRCNLACDYCYVYEMADQSWRQKPTLMDAGVVEQAARRIADHAETHGLSEVRIILHGGEPLLCGPRFLRSFVTTIRAAVSADVDCQFGMQTNAVLLDEEMARLCLELRIRLGISLDGGRSSNDRHRRYRNGSSSYDEVVRALDLLQAPELQPLLAGLLCTIDLENEPVATLEELLAFGPPSVDFLLPHGNWSEPPPHKRDAEATPYADWLIPIFDHWYGKSPRRTGIRFFEEIMNLLLGGSSHVESIGLTPVNLIVVEVDGSLEQVDSLKAAFDGAPATGLNVFDNTFDEALRVPEVVARQIGVEGLCPTCRDCAVGAVCGGGLYPHRYKEGTGFLNPSVYCADLMKLIGHIRERLAQDLGVPPVAANG